MRNGAGALRLPLLFDGVAAPPASCPSSSEERACNRFHQSVREFAVANPLAQAGAVQHDLVIGDSIAEAARLPPRCGLQPLNGGIGGARTSDLIGMVSRLGASDSVQLLVIAVGVNDASPPRVSTIAEFAAAYEQLVADAGFPPQRLALVWIAPLERDKPLDTAYFDAARAREFDRTIRGLAIRVGATYVDLAARFAAADGTARIGTTTDGVHLTPSAYETWRRSIADAIAFSRVCPP